MEHFRNPFVPVELQSTPARQNRVFVRSLLQKARAHRFFSHPFLSTSGHVAVARAGATFILTSFYQVVAPFTGLLCSLAGQAPSLRFRFALMDNIYEEMGCGDWAAAHPNLYLKMLASVGVSEHAAEGLPTLPAIARLNQHLRAVVDRRHFSVACAVLASAEATIPASFPALLGIARSAFGDLDTAFFDRHGERDEGHADDAFLLFALSGQAEHFAAAEADVMLDLENRSVLLDEWQRAAVIT